MGIRSLPKTPVGKVAASYLAIAVFLLGFVPGAQAGFTGSEFVGVFDRAADYQTVQKVLELKQVAARLARLGFTEQEIWTRIDQMQDEQVHRLAVNLDHLAVGGDLGTVIALLVVIILVVVLVRLIR